MTTTAVPDGADTAALPVRIEAQGADTERALDDLPRLYAGTTWSTRAVGGRAFRYRYAAKGDTALTLRTSRMHGEVQGDIPPGDDYVVQWTTAGRATVDVGRDEVAMVPRRPMLFPAHRPFVFRYTDYDQRLVHLGREHVDRIAREQGIAGREPLRFDHLATPADGAVRAWFGTVKLVSDTVQTGPVSPLLWHELTRMTAIAFLDMYAPAGERLPSAALLPKNARIREAAEYLHAHADEPIGTVEIAAAAHLSVRALQEGFQRVFGTTPNAYLREVRLERVHDALRRGDAGASVGEVARSWGFVHLGRFAAAYRERFGEHPRDTLRR